MRRLADILGVLWPYLNVLDPGSSDAADATLPSATAVVFALHRYAVRFSVRAHGPPISEGILRRLTYFGTACAQRLLFELGGAAPPWLAASTALWTEAVVPGIPRDLVPFYLAQVKT